METWLVYCLRVLPRLLWNLWKVWNCDLLSNISRPRKPQWCGCFCEGSWLRHFWQIGDGGNDVGMIRRLKLVSVSAVEKANRLSRWRLLALHGSSFQTFHSEGIQTIELRFYFPSTALQINVCIDYSDFLWTGVWLFQRISLHRLLLSRLYNLAYTFLPWCTLFLEKDVCEDTLLEQPSL